VRARSGLVLALVLASCGSPGAGGSGGGGGSATGGDGGSGIGGSGGAIVRDGSATGGARADAGKIAPGGPDAAVPPDVAPDTGPDQCEPFAAQYCQRLSACSSIYLLAVYGDMKVCQDRIAIDCRTEVVLPGLDPTAVGTCQAALAGASCEDLFAGRIPACQRKGTLAMDAPCGAHGQCASGFCRMPETSFCGKCAPRGAEGATCDTTESCQFPLLCSEAGRCVTAAAEGDLCNETRPCRPGGALFCAADNSCKRRSAEGKACNASATAPRQPCEVGYTCRPSANGTCRAYQFAATGARCGLPSTGGGTVVLCRGSGSCVQDTCRPPGLDGEACTASPLGDSGGCLPPSLCLAGRCKLPDPASCM
jgi:hypothetical protein